jgi:RNA recognition motif. (a.k.a. RRM, RBD, or RNP domain)
VEIDFEKLLFQVRMVREINSSENKGYAFVSFRTTDMASKAIKELHNSEFEVCLYALLIMFVYCQMTIFQHIWCG